MMYLDYYDYIALIVFVLFAIFIPASFLLTSKLLRKNPPGNRVKGTNYESAEQPIGAARDVDNEYLPFFAIFLPFEIITMVLILWALAARIDGAATNILVAGLAVFAMVLAILGYKYTSDKNAGTD